MMAPLAAVGDGVLRCRLTVSPTALMKLTTFGAADE